MHRHKAFSFLFYEQFLLRALVLLPENEKLNLLTVLAKTARALKTLSSMDHRLGDS